MFIKVYGVVHIVDKIFILGGTLWSVGTMNSGRHENHSYVIHSEKEEDHSYINFPTQLNSEKQTGEHVVFKRTIYM